MKGKESKSISGVDLAKQDVWGALIVGGSSTGIDLREEGIAEFREFDKSVLKSLVKKIEEGGDLHRHATELARQYYKKVWMMQLKSWRVKIRGKELK